MILRDYQQKFVEAVFKEWEQHVSTLGVLPTGTGKTVCFAEIIRRMLPKRSMVIAHREELLIQARGKIEAIAGVACEMEMAELSASTNLFTRTPCVVATVQTMCKRFERFDPMDFGLLVIDESHHSTASSYVKVLDHFKKNPGLRILGVTATPDRADEEALGQIFDSVAFEYEILDAIHDGWLVPVEQQMVNVGDLDFSAVRTVAGELNQADLAKVMEVEHTLQGVVGSSIEIIGDRQAILFATSVKQAEIGCEIFNRHKPGMAGFVCGKTDREKRRQLMADFQSGKIQVLTNVGVATEGVDLPNTSVIIMARPTLSRSLYAQCAGRALRPLPGLVDGFSTPDERKHAISVSSKPTALIVDFVGNSGRHKLMTTADILGGKVSEEAVALAGTKAKAKAGAVRMVELLEEAEAELQAQKEEARRLDEARRARLVAKVRYSTRDVNPFDVFALPPVKERGWDAGKTLSSKERALLLKQGIDGDTMPYAQAKAILREMFRRWDQGLASYGQAKWLKRNGYGVNMSSAAASALMDAWKKNNWKRPEGM